MSKHVNRVSRTSVAQSNPFMVDLDSPVPEYISRDEYEANELVQTVRELVSNSRDDMWSGSASELLATAQSKMRLADVTAGQINQEIETIKDYLCIYDGIYHYCYQDGNMTQHVFCVPEPDEDGVW